MEHSLRLKSLLSSRHPAIRIPEDESIRTLHEAVRCHISRLEPYIRPEHQKYCSWMTSCHRPDRRSKRLWCTFQNKFHDLPGAHGYRNHTRPLLGSDCNNNERTDPNLKK